MTRQRHHAECRDEYAAGRRRGSSTGGCRDRDPEPRDGFRITPDAAERALILFSVPRRSLTVVDSTITQNASPTTGGGVARTEWRNRHTGDDHSHHDLRQLSESRRWHCRSPARRSCPTRRSPETLLPTSGGAILRSARLRQLPVPHQRHDCVEFIGTVPAQCTRSVRSRSRTRSSRTARERRPRIVRRHL